MNLGQYIERKKVLKAQEIQFRDVCRKCQQFDQWCYCHKAQAFDCGIKFVILLHPLENRRRIASGRMSHLLLKNSELILGHNYSNDPKVNELIANSDYYPVILYLGCDAIDLNSLSESDKKNICPPNKKLLVFVIDGTWNTASKTVKLSENLNRLPRIFFTPSKPSAFRVRQQPKAMCYSTLEAIHETINLLGDSQGFDTQSRVHDRMLNVFDSFVAIQADYVQNLKEKNGTLSYRKKK